MVYKISANTIQTIEFQYMAKSFLFFLLFIISENCVAQIANQFDGKIVQVKWELLREKHNDKGEVPAAFTFINKEKKVFPSQGWVIYFNSSQPITEAKATGGVIISHVNGDIYKIVPSNDFVLLKKKDSVVIKYYTNGTIINKTAAPSGLYIVWNNGPATGITLSDYTILPIPAPAEGAMTSEKIYLSNKKAKDIPAELLPGIFPTPVSYKRANGYFIWDADVVLQSDAGFQNEVGYFQHLSEELFGKRVFTAGLDKSDKRKIIFKTKEMPVEAYELSVTENNLVIAASSDAGIFYGIQSLLSLMPADIWKEKRSSVTIPGVEVTDAPRFGYRSLMLDVARNFKPKKTIFRILDLMALYKMNVLHFHFCDDEGWRIEIPSLPELTALGSRRGHDMESKTMLPPSYAAGPLPDKTLGSGYYSKNDFIEILKYAAERHILVMPEIESPGHSRAAIKSMDARYEKYKKQGNLHEAERFLLRDMNDSSVYSSAQQWTDNVMCVAKPSVYSFMEKVIDELLLMYKEAGAPISTIHIGGDEVPVGTWEKSPLCQQLIAENEGLKETNDLWYYYISRVNDIIRSKGLFISGWEEVGMRKTKLDGVNTMISNPRFANDNIQLHVWNNVTGWGAEDLPYRLANAGYKVILSPVSNNYLDFAYYKHPDEPGYYWGGFQDIDKPFYFIPFDYYKTSKEDPDGNPVDASLFIGKDRLTDFGKENIVGIQGLMWAENLRSEAEMEYLLLPKILGVAEKAWASEKEWETEKYNTMFQHLYDSAWSVFVNVIGKRELPRLDNFAGGFNYRIPAPGALTDGGKVFVNTQFPGLVSRFTTDGSEPTTGSAVYTMPIEEKGIIKIRTFDTKGRGSRTVIITNK